jgi:thymidine kinase
MNMAKLYFRHAAVNAGKTIQLLQIAHDYEVKNGKRILVLKPAADKKSGRYVVSRILDGQLRRECDFLIQPGPVGWLFDEIASREGVSLVLIDEAQFLTQENVWDLARVVTRLNIPVICFGLRSDFAGQPFEGSSHLFAMAQDIEEVTTRSICRESEKPVRATMNLRLIDGVPSFEGEQVHMNGVKDVTYIPVSLQRFMELYDRWVRQTAQKDTV